MDYSEDKDKFKDLLNQEYNWPARYNFKFIVRSGQETGITGLFQEGSEINTKASSGGKYISITISATMNNADEIIKIYDTASSITGIISL